MSSNVMTLMSSLKNGGCCHNLQMATSAIGTLGGWLGFFAFSFHYHNQTTAIWALASGSMAAAVLFLHVMYAVMKRTKEITNSQYNLNNAEDTSAITKTSTFYIALLVDCVAVVVMISGLQMATKAIGTLLFHYHNQTTAIWALASGYMAAAMLFLTVMYAVIKRTKVITNSQYNLNNAEDPSAITKTSIFYKALLVDGVAVVGMIVGLLTSFAYFGIGYNTEGLVIPSVTEIPHSHYTTSAWCFLTFVWSSTLLGFARCYRKINNEEHQPLVQDNTRRYMAI